MVIYITYWMMFFLFVLVMNYCLFTQKNSIIVVGNKRRQNEKFVSEIKDKSWHQRYGSSQFNQKDTLDMKNYHQQYKLSFLCFNNHWILFYFLELFPFGFSFRLFHCFVLIISWPSKTKEENGNEIVFLVKKCIDRIRDVWPLNKFKLN